MMERLLAREAVVRVLAVLVAVLLWLYVASQTVPLVTETVTVPVQALQVPAGLAVAAIEPEQVTVVVRGPAGALNQSRANGVQATINLKEADPGRTVRLVNAFTPPGVEVVQIVPPQVTVVIDRLAGHTVEVDLDVSGDPAAGLRAGTPQVRPDRVTVRGGARVVSTVRRVVAGLDIDGATRTVRQVLPVYAVDASGQPVLGVTLIPDRVEVEVPITRLHPASLLPVRPVVVGQPAPGAQVVAVRVTPDLAVVRAAEDVLARAGGIDTERVDIEGADRTVEADVTLQVPPGVELVGPERVRVTVVIRKGP